MSKAKSIKLITLISMLILSLVMAFGFFAPSKASAASSVDKSTIFKYTVSVESKVNDITFEKKGEETFAVIPMMEGEKLSFYRLLIIDDFEMIFNVSDDINEFSVNFPMSSYIATGNKKVDGTETSFVKTVENKVAFKKTSTGFDVTLNGETASITSSEITLGLTINEDNILCATVNGTAIAPATDDLYKVKVEDKATASVSFEMIDLADGVTSSKIDLKSVDSKASAGTQFEQNFELNASGNAFLVNATPRYNLNEAFINETGKLPAGVSVPAGKTLDGIVIVGEEYTITTTAHYLAHIDSTQPRIKASIDLDPSEIVDGVKYVVTPDTKKIKFTTPGFYNVSLVSNADESVVYETYYVYARSSISESEAPKYNMDATALESFKSELYDNLFTDDTKEKYIALGSNQYLTLPSMESLVSDDLTSYKNLTKTIYYATPENSSSYSSGDKIPVERAGKYSFYVVFKDKDGNAMKSEDFISYSTSDPNDISYGDYQDYIFEFEIFDNSNIEVTSRTQGTAYVGVSYTATNFKIESGQTTKTYKLYYSATRTTTPTGTFNYDWKEVVVASKATDPEYTYNGLSYNDVVTINYAGGLTFMPHATGYYKLTCMVTSSSSVRSDEAEVIIESKTPTEVDPIVFASNVNVPQVIFLSVGGACLIGIVALLFVKPKQKKED